MAEYDLSIKRSAEKDLNKLPRDVAERILEKIRLLEDDILPPASKKLINMDGYRLRVGDYRVLYTADEESGIVEITAVLHRKDAYR